MDENNTIIDLTAHLDSKIQKSQEKKSVPVFHSNPIFKKFLLLHNQDTKHKFSLKDLFR